MTREQRAAFAVEHAAAAYVWTLEHTNEDPMASALDALLSPSPCPTYEEWERVENVTCVVCPGCAFTFDADHTDVPDGGYSCPACNHGTVPPLLRWNEEP